MVFFEVDCTERPKLRDSAAHGQPLQTFVPQQARVRSLGALAVPPLLEPLESALAGELAATLELRGHIVSERGSMPPVAG